MSWQGAGAEEVVRGVPRDSPLSRALDYVLNDWLGLHSTVPEPLYHYTNIGGLEGIVNSNGFWASYAEYLNDASELTYATSLIHEVIGKEARQSGPGWFATALGERPELANPFAFGLRPFVVCFCGKGDLLSQWRGYGSSGPAYSLGLELSPRSGALRTPPVGDLVLRKVIYARETQERLVRQAVQAWWAAFSSEIAAGRDETTYPALFVLQRMLIEHYLCFKNPAVEEEEEWRLILAVDVREEFATRRASAAARKR